MAFRVTSTDGYTYCYDLGTGLIVKSFDNTESREMVSHDLR